MFDLKNAEMPVAPKGIWSNLKYLYLEITDPNDNIERKYSSWLPFSPIISFVLLLSAGFGAYLWFKQFGPLSFYVLGIEDTIYLTLVGIFWSFLFLIGFFALLLSLMIIAAPLSMGLRAVGLKWLLPFDSYEGLLDWKASMNMGRYLILLSFIGFVVLFGQVIGFDKVLKTVAQTFVNAVFFARGEGQSWVDFDQIAKSIEDSEFSWLGALNGGHFGIILFFVIVAVAELFDHSDFHQNVSRFFYLVAFVAAPCIGSYFYLDVMHPRQKVEVFYADSVNAGSHVCADRETDSKRIALRFETKMVWSGAKAALIECSRIVDKKTAVTKVLIQGPENLRIQMRERELRD
jgi:hypothetical protein